MGVVALTAYWLLLGLVLFLISSDSDEGSGEYNATRKRLRYDYFNTNPIYVLRHNYLERDDHDHRNIVYFQRGKEYLQRTSKRQDGIKLSREAKKAIGACCYTGRAHELLDVASTGSSLSEKD